MTIMKQTQGGGAPGNSSTQGIEPNNQSICHCGRSTATAKPTSDSGFTLAEVLITLGIIGIVAAMTLPALINKAEKVILAQQFKKTFANLQNAVNLAQGEYGMPYECYNFVYADYRSSECKMLWQNVLPKLKVIKVCGYDDANCHPKYKTKAEVLAAGGQVDNLACSLSGALGNHKVYTLYDGSYLIINDAQNSTIYSLWILIDVNGEKGPNKWGYDVFWTSLYRENYKKNIVVFDEICKMKEKGGVYFKDMILK